MSKDSGFYKVPSCCRKCGSTDIMIKALIMDNGAMSCQAHCLECGDWYNLPKQENLLQRNNSPLARWANNVKYRDGRKCVICGRDVNLEAHHIIPVSHSRKYVYDENNGITLCKDCHWLVHHRADGRYDVGE